MRQLMAEWSIQLGDDSNLRQFFADFTGEALSRFPLTRWDMPGFEDQTKCLLDQN